MEKSVELFHVLFRKGTEVLDCNRGCLVNLAHALLVDAAPHLVLASELAELLALELGADVDAVLLAEGVDEVLVLLLIAVVGKEDELRLLGLDRLDGLSVSGNQIAVDSDLLEMKLDTFAVVLATVWLCP